MSKPKNSAKYEAIILLKKHLQELGLGWVTEALFHSTRKWRWDFVLYLGGSESPQNVAVEIQGGFYRAKGGGQATGGHNSITGMQRDMDKRNAGVVLGWRVLTFSTADVLRGRAKAFLAEHLEELFGKRAA